MLEDFTVATFEPLLGDSFAMEAGPELRLSEATAHDRPGAAREPFSLVFTGPPQPVLPQGIRRIEHASLGAFELFLVPIGRDDGGVRYEAVFG